MDANFLEIAFKMTVALGVVLLTFGASVFLVKKFSASGKFGSSKKNGKKNTYVPLEILAQRSLGPAKTVYVLKYLDKVMVVGATNQNISAIAQFEEGVDLEEDFETSLQGSDYEEKGSSIKDQIGSKLREIARV